VHAELALAVIWVINFEMLKYQSCLSEDDSRSEARVVGCRGRIFSVPGRIQAT
jgi:hypothetical protein